MQTGHFTAMVWKESTLLGIGCASVSGRVVVVACYKCCANMMGAFRENVLPYRWVVFFMKFRNLKRKKSKLTFYNFSHNYKT